MRKSFKITLSSIGSLLFLVILFSSLATIWISTPSGSATLVKWINQNVEGKLAVEKAELSWWGKQRLEKLSFHDKEGNLLFDLPQIETKTSLLYLLFGGRNIGPTIIRSPYIVIEEKEGEKTSATTPKEKKTKHLPFFSFEGPLLVTDGRITFVKNNIPIVALSNIQIERKEKKGPIQFQADSDFEGKKGRAQLDIDLAHRQAQIHLVDFPVAILDPLCPTCYLSEALGSTLSADFNLEQKEEQTFFLKGEAESDHLKAFIDGYTQNKQFILNPQTHLQWTLTPALFKILIDEKQRGNWDLASKTQLEIHIEKAIFPLSKKKGSFQDLTLQATAKIDRAELHHAHLGSYTLKQLDLSVIALNNIEISYQGEILGKEATQMTGNLSITPAWEILYQINFKGFPVTLLELFSSRMATHLRTLFGNQINLVSKGIVIGEKIDGELSLESPNTEAKGNIKGTIEKLFFEVQGTRSMIGEVATFLGKSIDFTLYGTLHAQGEEFYISSFNGKLSNPLVHLDVVGRMGEPQESFIPENIHLVATGTVSHLPIGESLATPAALFLEVDGSKNQILGKIEGSDILVDFEVSSFIHNQEIQFNKSVARFICELEDFPTEILNPIFSDTVSLETFIGPSVTLHAKGTYAPDKDPRLIIDLDASATGFWAQLALSIDGTITIDPSKPSYIRWEVTPQRYISFIQATRLHPEIAPTFFLTKPTEIEIHISQLTCPTTWPKKLGSFLCQSGFVGEIRIGNTTFQARNKKETIIFQELKGSIQGVDFSEAIDLNLSGEIIASSVPHSEQSAFSFEGQMLNFWTKVGKFNREHLTVKGVLNLEFLPVRPILGIIPLDQETRVMAQALLGELVNARILGEISQLSGPITVDIKSSNFKALLPLQMQPHGLMLRDYVDAEITLTEAVNEVFLKDINPLLLAGAYSEHPIKLYIDAQGFMIPLRPYSLEGIRIGRAVVDIGKIRVHNGGQIQALMEFLKAKEISPDGMMEAWFTPIIFSYQNGVATYQRFDMLLANSIQIALWGSINLINNHVNMTLGIAEVTLNQRFKISGLKEKDMFQIKMTGTTDHLDLDWGSASKRLAFILTRTTAGGGLGSLIGGILEAFSSSLGEEPVPPPTTFPFPWEKF